MVVKNLLVLGGTGFIGREIVKRAHLVGFKVTSLSRKGDIPRDNLSDEDIRSWSSKVIWRQGDASDKEMMTALLPNQDCVIHSIGILFENSFNTLVSGSKSDGSGLTYERQNMETALIPLSIIETTIQQPSLGIPRPFIFVSAISHPPFMKRFLTSKMEVEKKMIEMDKKGKIRSVIFRPGLVYHHSKWTSLPFAKFTKFVHNVDEACKSKLGLSIGVPDPTPLDLLATAAVRAAARPEVHGIIGNREMWELTTRETPEI